MTATIERPATATSPPAGGQTSSGRGLSYALVLAAAALGVWAVAAVAGADGFDDGAQVVRLALVGAWFAAGLLLAVRRPAEPIGALV
ncbi:MAG: hypothetical protein ACRDY6_23725, partial [Acidimicrobiia bacterium]